MRPYHMSGNSNCSCPENISTGSADYVLAMAYVPWQQFSTVYEPDRALSAGTIFPELDKPFLAAKGGRCR